MTRRLISSGSPFEAQIGYSRAVVAGDWVFVSGTTGFDYATMSIADGIPQQTEQCLKNIESALREAGSSLKDVVRVKCPAGRCRVRAMLAGVAQVFRRGAPGCHDDLCRSGGPAHEDRDRGDRAEGFVGLKSCRSTRRPTRHCADPARRPIRGQARPGSDPERTAIPSWWPPAGQPSRCRQHS